MINKLKAKINQAKTKAQSIVESTKAMSQTTEVILLIVLVVAVIGAFFAPEITEWFSGVMGDLATHTDDLFAFSSTI